MRYFIYNSAYYTLIDGYRLTDINLEIRVSNIAKKTLQFLLSCKRMISLFLFIPKKNYLFYMLFFKTKYTFIFMRLCTWRHHSMIP